MGGEFIVALVGGLIGLACGSGALLFYQKLRLRTAREQAEALLALANRDAEDIRKRAELHAKEESVSPSRGPRPRGRGRA